MAFGGCRSLKNINLPSVIEIADNAFRGCSALESIVRRPQRNPASVEEFGKGAKLVSEGGRQLKVKFLRCDVGRQILPLGEMVNKFVKPMQHVVMNFKYKSQFLHPKISFLKKVNFTLVKEMRADFDRPTNASVLKGKTPGITTELYGFYQRPIFESTFLYQTMRKVHKKTTTATTNGRAAFKNSRIFGCHPNQRYWRYIM